MYKNMIRVYEILMVIMILVYLCLWYYNNHHQENFDQHLKPEYFIYANTYDKIYDDFYGYIYDDLFYQEEYYLAICEIILKYVNHVFNNHLCIGIKHGGHINQLLKENMKTISVSRSHAVVNVCSYHYKENQYKFIPDVENNPYIFDENSFTHISLIDNELYYLTNLPGFFYNCERWLIFKGYLMIQCYHHKQDLKQAFLKIGENSSVRTKTIYSHEFKDFQDQNSFTLVETIKEKEKERKHRHSLYFYKKEYIKQVASEFGFDLLNSLSLSKHETIMVFQKI